MGAICEYEGVLHCMGYDYGDFVDDIMEAPLSEYFSARRMKMLSRPDGFRFYPKLGVDFFSTSEFQYPKMKNRFRLMRARPEFYMISKKPNVSPEFVNCSLYTRRITLKDDYHKTRMEMPANFPVEINCLETLAKSLIIPDRQNQFIIENIFNNTPARLIAIAMKANSAFTGSSKSFLVSTT